MPGSLPHPRPGLCGLQTSLQHGPETSQASWALCSPGCTVRVGSRVLTAGVLQTVGAECQHAALLHDRPGRCPSWPLCRIPWCLGGKPRCVHSRQMPGVDLTHENRFPRLGAGTRVPHAATEQLSCSVLTHESWPRRFPARRFQLPPIPLGRVGGARLPNTPAKAIGCSSWATPPSNPQQSPNPRPGAWPRLLV